MPARAIIFANGVLSHPDVTRGRIAGWLGDEPRPSLLAANGGAHNAQTLGFTPEVVIGDLDSLDETLREELAAGGCRFQTAPVRKDATDLELALQLAVREGADWLRVVGALGGRLDQTIANVLLLTLPVLDGVDVRLVEGPQSAWLVRGESDISGEAGDTLSLIPLGGEAEGVTTEGLEYPLHADRLPFGAGLGISNIMTGPQARVTVGDGLLLAVHTAGDTQSLKLAKKDL